MNNNIKEIQDLPILKQEQPTNITTNSTRKLPDWNIEPPLQITRS